MKPSSKTAKYQSGNCILQPTEELGALVLGDCNSAMDKKIHKEFDIQTIVSIGQEAMPLKSKLPQNCKHYFYDIHDNKSQKVPTQLFDQVSKIIEEGRKTAGVLVHCYAGVSRSSTFVIAYIMQKWNKSYDAAKEEVKSARNCIYPNDGFVHHLKHYDKILQKREEQRLRRLQEEKRLQMEKSLVKSSRKCVRGGVRSADQSPDRVKQMEEERKKHTHEIILQPIISAIKEQKQEVSEKEILERKKPYNSLKSSLDASKIQQNKANIKSAFLNREKLRLNKERKKEEVKFPLVLNKSPYNNEFKKKEGYVRYKSKGNENLEKHPLSEHGEKYRSTKFSTESFRRTEKEKPTSTSMAVPHKKHPLSESESRSVLRESKSVMSSTKYKSTTFEIDESLLTENEKKVKKIYENKVIVR